MCNNRVVPNLKRSGKRARCKCYILQVDSYTGEDTTRDQHEILDEEKWNEQEISALYAVVRIEKSGASIADDGYRSIAEAQEAWPEAIAPKLTHTTRTQVRKNKSTSGQRPVR